MKNRTKKIILTIGLTIALVFGLFFGYLSSSYEPTPLALSALESSEYVTVTETEDYFSFIPIKDRKDSGFIFYQGGKVEEEAYAPLMYELAARGIPSYLVRMPFNLAVFDSQAAGDIIEQEAHIPTWYVGGHSLGGAMASSFAEKNPTPLNGLILLAAYASKDLTSTELHTLSIYGDNDTVLDSTTYQENRAYLPNLEEVILPGGNHAQFGAYGSQDGDSPATLSALDQQRRTVEAIASFINETSP